MILWYCIITKAFDAERWREPLAIEMTLVDAMLVALLVKDVTDSVTFVMVCRGGCSSQMQSPEHPNLEEI